MCPKIQHFQIRQKHKEAGGRFYDPENLEKLGITETGVRVFPGVIDWQTVWLLRFRYSAGRNLPHWKQNFRVFLVYAKTVQTYAAVAERLNAVDSSALIEKRLGEDGRPEQTRWHKDKDWIKAAMS